MLLCFKHYFSRSEEVIKDAKNSKLIFRSNYEDEYIFHCSKIELRSFTGESMHAKTDLDAYWLLQAASSAVTHGTAA